MKFVHMADVHFDAPFTTISDRAELGQERRIEQREAFKKVIDFVKENNIEFLFISGDLYENEYVRKSTIEYINKLFSTIPKTNIFIVPGNHDPLLKNSYYNTYTWEKNVIIFDSKPKKVTIDNVNIYGYGFDNFEMNKNQLQEINIDDYSKINILITHGTISSGNNQGIYNPINKKELDSKQFDYVAIGHIHKRDDYYPGSLISLGFDELGEHGFICGEIIDKKLYKTFIKVDEREFIEKKFDVSNIKSNEDLIEELNNEVIDNNLYKFILTGKREFSINIDMKLLTKNIIKVKDDTKLNYELKENNNTLKGICAIELNKKLKNEMISEEKYKDVTEILNNIFNI